MQTKQVNASTNKMDGTKYGKTTSKYTRKGDEYTWFVFSEVKPSTLASYLHLERRCTHALKSIQPHMLMTIYALFSHSTILLDSPNHLWKIFYRWSWNLCLDQSTPLICLTMTHWHAHNLGRSLLNLRQVHKLKAWRWTPNCLGDPKSPRVTRWSFYPQSARVWFSNKLQTITPTLNK
jgi:hypothetical protein